jgi:hypothetical protein
VPGTSSTDAESVSGTTVVAVLVRLAGHMTASAPFPSGTRPTSEGTPPEEDARVAASTLRPSAATCWRVIPAATGVRTKASPAAEATTGGPAAPGGSTVTAGPNTSPSWRLAEVETPMTGRSVKPIERRWAVA